MCMLFFYNSMNQLQIQCKMVWQRKAGHSLTHCVGTVIWILIQINQRIFNLKRQKENDYCKCKSVIRMY